MSSQGIEKLSGRNWIIAVSSFIAIICYFLPWYGHTALGVMFLSRYSGLSLSLVERTASGIPLASFFATIIAAFVCLILCVVYNIQGRNTKKIIPLIQIFFGIMGLVPFVLFYFVIKYWQRHTGGGEVWFSYFFMIAILAMIGIIIGAILSYIEIKRHSISR